MNKTHIRQKASMYIFALCFAGLFAGLSPTNDAHAGIRDTFSGKRPITLDAPIVGLQYVGLGGAAGIRVGIPIVHNGFIPNINNAVYINFGADFYWTGYGNKYGMALGFPVTMHWAFYFTRQWSAFAELGVNIYLNPELFEGGAFLFGAGFFYGAIGGKFHISPSFALVLRLGFPYTSFGLSFSF